MKKIKLLSILVACSLFLAACGNNTNTTSETKAESSGESNGEKTTETVAETKEEKPVERIDLRSKDSKYLTVDGKEVSYSEFFKYYDLYSGIIAMQQQLGSNLTDLVVRNVIITKDLEDKKVEVTDEEVNAEIDKFKQSIGTENDYKKYLNLIGVSDEIFRDNIKNSVKAKKHKELFASENKATDDEIQKAYEASKDNLDYVVAKHILVEDESLAKEISDKLKNGEEFKTLSDEYSIDQAAKAKGGELGNVTKAQFDADFVEAAFKLNVDEVSDPVKTKNGYHVIVVTENAVGIDKHKEQLEKTVTNQKYESDLKTKVGTSDIKLYDYDGEEIKNNQR